jgi:hypothetical protein
VACRESLLDDNIPNEKGEQMKKHFLKIMMPLFAFTALALTAKAQESDQLNVNVPYEFVVGGKTMPAGTYRIGRISTSTDSELFLSSFENHTGVLVVPSQWTDARTNATRLVFEQINGQHFLSKIETAEHVFTIPVSQSAIQEAISKSSPVSASTTISKSN